MYVKKTVLQAITLYFPKRKIKYYTEAEDKDLLKFIVQHERYKAACLSMPWGDLYLHSED
jgi:hypothetical protein